MTQQQTGLSIVLQGLQTFDGPSHLWRKPVVVGAFTIEGESDPAAARNLQAALARQALSSAQQPLWPELPQSTTDAAALVAAGALALQRAVGLPLDDWRVVPLRGSQVLCFTPYLVARMAEIALGAAADLVVAAQGAAATLDALLAGALERLRACRPPRLALMTMFGLHRNGLPWRILERANWTLEVGHGAALRRLRISLPDDQSFCGQQLCEDKTATLEVLRAAGLPVPDSLSVASPEQAVEAARKIGYPVVVKPRDGSMGAGVGVDLRSEEEVVAAYRAARALFPRVLVERFIVGRPYRLLVVDGRLLHAVQRPTPEVVGDGETTLGQLIERMNAEPHRHNNDDMSMAPFNREEDPLDFRRQLEEQGLTEESVPAAGRLVRLGLVPHHYFGPYRDVMASLHPAVVAMAEAAAVALDLATAGVDYLTPDISEPPERRASAINEVNVASWVTPHFYAAPALDLVGPLVLPRLGEGGGHIPIAALSDGVPDGLAERLADGMARAGIAVGRAGATGATLPGGQALPPPSAGGAARQLLADRRVAAAVISLGANEGSERGLPFDLCDLAVLAGPPAGGGASVGRRAALAASALVAVTRRAVVAPLELVAQFSGGVEGQQLYLVADRPQAAPEKAVLVTPQEDGRLVRVRAPDGGQEALAGPEDCPPSLAAWLVACLLGLGFELPALRRLFTAPPRFSRT